MTGKSARLIFWFGTLSSALIFLWLTYDFHRQMEHATLLKCSEFGDAIILQMS